MEVGLSVKPKTPIDASIE
jgi:ribulose-phosphate 3-epimerase